MSKNWLVLIGLVIYCAVILSPPLIHGYVYPNIGDDTAVNLSIFDRMATGTIKGNMPYLAYIIVGIPLIFASKVFHVSIDILFLWFNYVSLCLVGIIIYYVMSRLVGKTGGAISLVLTIFCAQGLMFYFYYGQTFNFINIGMIFPLVIYFAVRYFQERKIYHLVILGILVGLFSCFHASGIYLPAMAITGVVLYVIMQLSGKQIINKKIIAIGLSLLICSLLVFGLLVYLPTVIGLEYKLSQILTNIGKGLAVPFGYYVMDILSPTILLLAVLVMVYMSEIKKQMTNKEKTTLFLLLAMFIPLGIASFGKLSLDPWRQAVDFTTMFALFVGVLLSVLLKRIKNIVIIIVVIALIGFGVYHNITTWFGYNSAITKVDLEAISYIDGSKTFSCSGNLAYWIYERYTDSVYSDIDGEVILVRNKPMTPRSTEGNIWYQAYGLKPNSGYQYDTTFSDGEITVEVYIKVIK